MRCVITFDSVHFVMKAESILRAEGVKVQLTPTPRKISSDCGMALEVRPKDIEMIERILNNRGCKTAHVHEFSDSG
jgi:hypothetical protein